MKKILTYFAVFVLMLSTCLVGCNLISRDNKAYYSQVVAKAGNVEVTFEEVYEMCNYIKYYNNVSTLTEEQVTKVCQDLLDQKLYLYHFSADESVKLTEKEKNYIYSQVYESINNTIYQYEQRAKWGAVLYQTRSSSDSTTTNVYENYESIISYSFDDGFVVNSSFKPLKTLDYKPEFEFVSDETESVKSSGRNAYFNALRDSAKILGKIGLTNSELLNNEIERIFRSYCDSALILKINYQHIKDSNGAITELNNEIFDDFVELVKSEKETLEGKNVSNVTEDSQGSIGSVKVSDVEALYAYCPKVITKNFFEVCHILLKSSSDDNEIKERLEGIKAEIEAKFVAINGCTSIAEVESVIDSLDMDFVYNGHKTLENLDAYKNFAKECVFTAYMFENSEDSATLSTEKNFVIPVNSSLDTMVKAFADASRLLHEHEEGEGDEKVTVAGKPYDLSEVVKTTYGYHLIMYVGEVEKIVDETSFVIDADHEITESEKAELLKSIATKPLKIAHNKTTYNVLTENIIGEMKLFESYYNKCLEYEKNVITENKLENKIYKDRMKELWA